MNRYKTKKISRRNNQSVFNKGLKRPQSSKPKTGLALRGGIKR